MEETHDAVRIRRYRYAPMRDIEVLTNPGAIAGRIKENPLLALMVPSLFWGLNRAVAHELASSDYACVHSHWLIPQGAVQSRLRQKGRSPAYVVTSHGGDLGLLPNRVLEPIYRKVLRNAGAVTAVAPWMVRKLIDIEPSLEPKNIPVISMGADLNRFSPGRRAKDWRLRHRLQGLVVLFVGRLMAKKGVGCLIDAMSTDELRKLDVSLAIIGDGPQKQQLKAQVDRLSLRERVRFFGAMGHDTLPEALASSDIFCVPSVVAENGDIDGTPTVLFEAGASSLPIIGSDLAGIPTMVVPEKTGLLVPPGDISALARAIHRLAIDDSLRLQLGAAALQHAGDFSWTRIARQFVQVFDGAISRSAQPV